MKTPQKHPYTVSNVISHADNRNVLLMPGIFNETLQLLVDAQQYFELFGEQDQGKVTPQNRIIYSCEMSRITLRLSSVMAWLMVRKAVFSGKISDGAATEQFRLDCQDICLFRNPEAQKALPPFMYYLLERSLELYERICRLQDVSARTH